MSEDEKEIQKEREAKDARGDFNRSELDRREFFEKRRLRPSRETEH